jgi:predicted nucleotidyltransferase
VICNFYLIFYFPFSLLACQLPTVLINFHAGVLRFFGLNLFTGVDICFLWCYNYSEEKAMEKEQDVLIIKQFINQVIPYKKEIVFFGSRAEGGYKKDSDYDLLVIVHHNNADRKKLIGFQAKIKRLCAKAGLDADVIVRDNAHAEEMKNFPGNIIHSALKTGVYI